jgi:adenine specific DNA methylase Mod
LTSTHAYILKESKEKQNREFLLKALPEEQGRISPESLTNPSLNLRNLTNVEQGTRIFQILVHSKDWEGIQL